MKMVFGNKSCNMFNICKFYICRTYISKFDLYMSKDRVPLEVLLQLEKVYSISYTIEFLGLKVSSCGFQVNSEKVKAIVD